jgi:hypothetical protein
LEVFADLSARRIIPGRFFVYHNFSAKKFSDEKESDSPIVKAKSLSRMGIIIGSQDKLKIKR